MTLKEYIEQNGNKPIEIQEDGTIRILEEKGPWKPKNYDRYFHLCGNGDLEETYWFGWDSEDRRAELGNVFQTLEEAKRMVHRLKARKKFLDAGGHAGVPDSNPNMVHPLWIVSPTELNALTWEAVVVVPAFEIWFKCPEDCQKAIDSLTKDEVAALCWTGDEE